MRKTRLYIRQRAAEGRLTIRGRHEIEVVCQDRTTFSDLYTEIPSAYWKHSVINVLATGALYENERHTNPETVYAWGPKGLHEPNCYSGLQLNSNDVSQLIGDVRAAGAQMSKKEEWISAAGAIALLGMSRLSGARAICKRAHARLIAARAQRFISGGRSADNVDIPAEFWWAEDDAALTQDWRTGDFETWINNIRLQAFGVTFRRSDIEGLKPTPVVENAASTRAEVLEERKRMTAAGQKIFIGHGHSLVWRELQNFLQSRLHLTTDEFNSVTTAGVATSNRLEEMLDNAAFAFVILTAEDEQPDGTLRPRENVVHEAGLFQGRLGFKKAILLLENTCEKFSNAVGLGHIPFPPGDIKATFEQVREVLEREKVIDPLPKPAGDPPPGSTSLERRSRLRYTHPRSRKE
jgi:predicted nucleotide-binding protein